MQQEAAKQTAKRTFDDAHEQIRRLITACKRCRSKKIKCDRKMPQCSNCDKSGELCVSLDPATGELVSRLSIHDLERKLRETTEELNALKLLRKAEEPAMPKVNNEFKFGKVLLMKDNEIDENFHSEAADVEIPARQFVETCLQLYFTLSNVQIPILHRDHYLFDYFRPLYGEVGVELWKKLLGDNFRPESCTEKPFATDKIDPLHRGRCLFFLYIIVAILTSQHQQKYPLMISNHYKKQAFKYVDYVWNSVDQSGEDELTKLEMLQSLLLLTQYSLMRPCTPGAWYLVGTCVKLCQDLGLHQEPVYLHTDDYYIVDMRRRLFWCCYSLDRQISIYFGRPFGFDSRMIDCPLPSVRDDLVLIQSSTGENDVRHWLIKEPDSKLISIHFFNLRVLQGEIFDFIHNTGNRVQKPRFKGFEDPTYERKTQSHDLWKSQKHVELLAWFNDVPSKSVVYRQFNEMVFKLNLNQTVIQLYSVSAITPVITDMSHHKILFEAGQEIIWTYVKLVEMNMINFSWVAINNLFMGATVYLSLIMLSDQVRTHVRLSELRLNCAGVVMVFDELCKICYEPAKDYSEKFRAHSATVIDTCEKERQLKDSLQTSESMRKGFSESNTFSSVESNSTPAMLVAPVPQRSSSILQIADEFTDFMGLDHDVFLNNMMGSINATYEGLDPEFEIYDNGSLDHDY